MRRVRGVLAGLVVILAGVGLAVGVATQGRVAAGEPEAKPEPWYLRATTLAVASVEAEGRPTMHLIEHCYSIREPEPGAQAADCRDGVLCLVEVWEQPCAPGASATLRWRGGMKSITGAGPGTHRWACGLAWDAPTKCMRLIVVSSALRPDGWAAEVTERPIDRTVVLGSGTLGTRPKVAGLSMRSWPDLGPAEATLRVTSAPGERHDLIFDGIYPVSDWRGVFFALTRTQGNSYWYSIDASTSVRILEATPPKR